MSHLISGRYNPYPTLPTPVSYPGAPVPILVDAYGRPVLSPSSQLQLVDGSGNALSFDFDLKTDFAANSVALATLNLVLAELRAIRLALTSLACDGNRASPDDFTPEFDGVDPRLTLL